MREEVYNDYIEITKSWLYAYCRIEATIKKLESEQQMKRDLLTSDNAIAVPIARYGNAAIGRGSVDGSAVESLAMKRIKASTKASVVEQDIEAGRKFLARIAKGMESLNIRERDLVRHRFFERLTWRETASRLGISKRWATEVGNEVIQRLAICIFGEASVMRRDRCFNFI